MPCDSANSDRHSHDQAPHRSHSGLYRKNIHPQALLFAPALRRIPLPTTTLVSRPRLHEGAHGVSLTLHSFHPEMVPVRIRPCAPPSDQLPRRSGLQPLVPTTPRVRWRSGGCFVGAEPMSYLVDF